MPEPLIIELWGGPADGTWWVREDAPAELVVPVFRPLLPAATEADMQRPCFDAVRYYRAGFGPDRAVYRVALGQ